MKYSVSLRQGLILDNFQILTPKWSFRCSGPHTLLRDEGSVQRHLREWHHVLRDHLCSKAAKSKFIPYQFSDTEESEDSESLSMFETLNNRIFSIYNFVDTFYLKGDTQQKIRRRQEKSFWVRYSTKHIRL